MPVVTLPFAEWAPDQFPIGSPGAATITNVVPRTATTYGPMPTASQYSGALSARCIGSHTIRDTAKNAFVFAGDASKLYLLRAGSTNFTDVSGAVYTGAPWPDTQWAFTSFGLRVIAFNFNDPTQTFLVGTDAVFSNLSSSAPRARFGEAVGDFIMLANTFDGTHGTQPQRVWWSAVGDPTSWPTPGTTAAIQVQSDYQDLQQTDLGQISGLAAGPLPAASCTIFCERGVYTALYVGSPAIFTFKVVDGAPGCICPRSIIKGHINSGGAIIPAIFYRAREGFYAFNGTTSTPIGARRVDVFFNTDRDFQLQKTVLGVANLRSKMVFWAYSTAASTGLYDRLLGYNWDVDRWCYIDLTSAKIEWITISSTIGYTLEELDAFGTIDTLPYPLDSEAWVGGEPRIAVFNSSHRLAYVTAANMAATVETPEIEPIPGKRVFIRNVRPLVDVTGGSAAVGVRDRQADAITLKTAILMNARGECPQRQTGRYAKIRFTQPAASDFTHLSGVEVDVVERGIR